MPCNTIQTVSVQSELKNLNLKHLRKALEAMGFTVNEREGVLTFYGIHKETGFYHKGVYSNGKLNEQLTPGAVSLEVNAVKRAYSAQIVQQTAMSFGWKLTKKSANKYVATKG